MVSSYYYDGNEYIPRTSNDASKGFILATLASSAIMGTLPAFSKPFSSQLIIEHTQNDLYKDAFEKSINISGLDRKGVTVEKAQNFSNRTDVRCGMNAYYQPNENTKADVMNLIDKFNRNNTGNIFLKFNPDARTMDIKINNLEKTIKYVPSIDKFNFIVSNNKK